MQHICIFVLYVQRSHLIIWYNAKCDLADLLDKFDIRWAQEVGTLRIRLYTLSLLLYVALRLQVN